jgi:hypothetical protein
MKGFLFQTACRTAIVIFLLAACLIGKGQEASEEDFNSDPAFMGTVLTENPDQNTLKTPEIRKVSFSFSTGMMLGTMGMKNNFAAAYIAPAVAYNISPRLRVRAGALVFFNSFYHPAVASSQSAESPAGLRNNLALFVAADYFITDRISITGSYYIPSESMSLGLNYRIAKGFYIGAEFRFSNDYQPSLNSYPLLPGNTPYNPLYW